ncbi:serine/threonine-protein kinase RsbW [Hymenobacter luteus]|uniref:Serine/threonine-protein kinase RsbW n=2 Tax=Hymenobacter TaxID=89966 RepID=A0A7W9SYL0_9BACT|nr:MULTISPECIES: ATP-binding protein [Hymenobacter]MBB4600106.1 serine/threonine-protein kinase RsbW [Hymenobacter latericoloratus]MBB6057584.1 serine/threonine-protein kinase RsbW [Hymenobacter luteus]
MEHAIRISCTRRNLKVVRDFVSDFLLRYHLTDLLVNQIVLAVDEVVANLIIHGNGEDESQFLDVRARILNKEFGIEIEDTNLTSYSPASYREPDLQEYVRIGKKGGVGMMLVNRIMDRVEFTTNGGHNLCRLYKKIG